MNLSYTLAQVTVHVPRRTNKQPAKQRGHNELVKCSSSMNPRLLSRRALFSSIIAHYHKGMLEHKRVKQHAMPSKNLYFGTKPWYKRKWAQATQMPGACWADCSMVGHEYLWDLLIEQEVEVLGYMGVPKFWPILRPNTSGKYPITYNTWKYPTSVKISSTLSKPKQIHADIGCFQQLDETKANPHRYRLFPATWRNQDTH